MPSRLVCVCAHICPIIRECLWLFWLPSIPAFGGSFILWMHLVGGKVKNVLVQKLNTWTTPIPAQVAIRTQAHGPGSAHLGSDSGVKMGRSRDHRKPSQWSHRGFHAAKGQCSGCLCEVLAAVSASLCPVCRLLFCFMSLACNQSVYTNQDQASQIWGCQCQPSRSWGCLGVERGWTVSQPLQPPPHDSLQHMWPEVGLELGSLPKLEAPLTVCSGCRGPGWRSRPLLSHSSRGWKSTTKVPGGLLCGCVPIRSVLCAFLCLISSFHRTQVWLA